MVEFIYARWSHVSVRVINDEFLFYLVANGTFEKLSTILVFFIKKI